MVCKIRLRILLTTLLFSALSSPEIVHAAAVSGTAKSAGYQIAAVYAQQNAAQEKRDLASARAYSRKARNPGFPHFAFGKVEGPFLKILHMKVSAKLISVSLVEQRSCSGAGIAYSYTPRQDMWVRDGNAWHCKTRPHLPTAPFLIIH